MVTPAMLTRRIRAVCAYRDTNVTKVLKETGLSANTLTAMFSNNGFMKLDSINKIAKYFNVDFDTFLADDGMVVINENGKLMPVKRMSEKERTAI